MEIALKWEMRNEIDRVALQMGNETIEYIELGWGPTLEIGSRAHPAYPLGALYPKTPLAPHRRVAIQF